MPEAQEAEDLGPLVSVVAGVATRAGDYQAGRSPQLFALVKVSELREDPTVPAELTEGTPADELIPVEQSPLPEGDPDEVLAGISWPRHVDGCVLVTDIVILSQDDEANLPSDQGAAERWAASRPDKIEATLAVGVLRDGQYTCCLRLPSDDRLLVRDDMADDLVAALLGTF